MRTDDDQVGATPLGELDDVISRVGEREVGFAFDAVLGEE